MARKITPQTQSDAPGVGHNSAAQDENDRVQLISIVTKLTKHNEDVDAAKVAYDAARKARNATFKIAGAAGFTRKEIEARMEEMNRPTFENVQAEQREQKHRRWLGIITPEQREMHLSEATPETAKTLMDRQSDGYKVGLVAGLRKAPAGCTGEDEQAWLRGYDSGMNDGQAAIAANLKPSIREQAAADFAEDNPDFDEVAAARKLKNSSFMERGELEDGTPIVGDDFEATPEELAEQSARPSVQDAEAEAQIAAEEAIV